MLKEFPNNKEMFGDNDLFPRTPLREWIRKYIPDSRSGYNDEDLDLIHLRFGKAIGRDKDADGKFLLVEWKMSNREMPYAQKRVFGLIDRLMRIGDPAGEFYQGFYYIRWDGLTDVLLVNGQSITQEEFQRFLMGELLLKPFEFHWR